MTSTLAGLLTVVLAVGPGYLFTRYAEVRRQGWERSQLLELTELIVVGGACTALATFAAVSVAANCFEAISWRHLVSDPAGYVTLRPAQMIVVFVCILVLAYALAQGLAWLLFKGRPKTLAPGTLWSRTLPAALDKKVMSKINAGLIFDRPLNVFATVELKDGRLVQGIVFEYSLEAEVSHRDLAMRRPLTVVSGGIPTALQEDFMVIPGEEVRMFTLKTLQAPDE